MKPRNSCQRPFWQALLSGIFLELGPFLYHLFFFLTLLNLVTCLFRILHYSRAFSYPLGRAQLSQPHIPALSQPNTGVSLKQTQCLFYPHVQDVVKRVGSFSCQTKFILLDKNGMMVILLLYCYNHYCHNSEPLSPGQAPGTLRLLHASHYLMA